MTPTSIRYLPYFLGACLLSLALFHPSARAELIGTEQILAPAQADQERERVKALVVREDVAKQLQMLGISPEQAQGRIAAMTDAEVHTIAGKLDALPAGGLSDFQFVIVILLVVIVVILLV